MDECTYPNIGFDPNFDLNYVLDFPKYCRVYPEAALCVIWSYKKNLTNSRQVWMWITPIIVLIKSVFSRRSETINPLQPRFVCVWFYTLIVMHSFFFRSSFVKINFSYWLFSRSPWFSDINRNSFTTVPDLKTHKTHVYSLHQPELQVVIDFDGKKH